MRTSRLVHHIQTAIVDHLLQAGDSQTECTRRKTVIEASGGPGDFQFSTLSTLHLPLLRDTWLTDEAREGPTITVSF